MQQVSFRGEIHHKVFIKTVSTPDTLFGSEVTMSESYARMEVLENMVLDLSELVRLSGKVSVQQKLASIERRLQALEYAKKHAETYGGVDSDWKEK